MNIGQLTTAAAEEIGMSISLATEIKLQYPQTPDDRIATFLRTAHRLGLDIQARQIYMINRKSHGQDKWSIETSIDGFRLIADRTGNYAPGRETEFIFEPNGDLVSATVFVKKLVAGVWHEVGTTARWSEYGGSGFIWGKFPTVMLAKCAEALGLRRCFPAELSGIYTDDEMSQSEKPPTTMITDSAGTPVTYAKTPVAEGLTRDINSATTNIANAVITAPQPPIKPTFEGNPVATSLMDLITAKQLGMIRAISREIGIDAEEECANVLGCKNDELGKKGASFFIQHLQYLQKEGESVEKLRNAPQTPKPVVTELPGTPGDNDMATLLDEIEKLIAQVGGDDEESRKVILNGRNLIQMDKAKLIAFREDLRSM